MALAVRVSKHSKILKSVTVMIRSIASTSQRLANAEEDLKSNPFFEKYASKIQKLQKADPEEFLTRLETSISSKLCGKLANKNDRTSIQPGEAKSRLQHTFTKVKKLEDVMKTELLLDKTPEEITDIWLRYHKDKDVIAGIIPKNTYCTIQERGQEFSTFLLPLPRNKGYEFILSQFNGNEVHFTPLIAYQTHKENAPECLTIVHYTDLSDDKGIVLMKGDYNTDILQSHEAQCLINELQMYYAHNNDKRIKMLHRFTYSPDEFKHMDLIAELECLSL